MNSWNIGKQRPLFLLLLTTAITSALQVPASTRLALAPQQRPNMVYTIQELPSLPNLPYCGPRRINKAGNIIGNASDAMPPIPQAVIWKSGKIATLATTMTRVNAINTTGTVVGEAEVKGLLQNSSYAAHWNGHQVTSLSTIGTSSSRATGINDQGAICGSKEVGGKTRAFLWNHNKYRLLNTLAGTTNTATDLNNKGQVVGYSFTKSHVYHACLWNRGRTIDLGTLPGLPYSVAERITETGCIVGSCYAAPNLSHHAFRWKAGKMTALGTIAGFDSSDASDINVAEEIVGSCAKKPTSKLKSVGSDQIEDGIIRHAFLYRHGKIVT